MTKLRYLFASACTGECELVVFYPEQLNCNSCNNNIIVIQDALMWIGSIRLGCIVKFCFVQLGCHYIAQPQSIFRTCLFLSQEGLHCSRSTLTRNLFSLFQFPRACNIRLLSFSSSSSLCCTQKNKIRYPIWDITKKSLQRVLEILLFIASTKEPRSHFNAPLGIENILYLG